MIKRVKLIIYEICILENKLPGDAVDYNKVYNSDTIRIYVNDPRKKDLLEIIKKIAESKKTCQDVRDMNYENSKEIYQFINSLPELTITVNERKKKLEDFLKTIN